MQYLLAGGIVGTVEGPAGLSTCSDEVGFFPEMGMLIEQHWMPTATCVYHKVHWMAPYLNYGHRLSQGQLEEGNHCPL